MRPPDLPRLPPLVSGAAEAFDDATPSTRHTDGWELYEEPELVSTAVVDRLTVLARVGTVSAAVLLLVATLSGDVSGEGAGWLVVVEFVWVAVASSWVVIGVVWSRKHTENAHRLGARLPGRVRCYTAWIAPTLWTTFLMVAVLSQGPTEVFDIRPLIVVTVFLSSMWRPHALVRQILRSFTILRSDPLIGTSYVLDAAGFGSVFWVIWRSPHGAASGSSSGSLVGLSAAALVAFLCGGAAWWFVVSTVRGARGMRQVALRTRFEHNQLRRRGIDPLDPAVRLVLAGLRASQPQAAPDADQPMEAADEHANEHVSTPASVMDDVGQRRSRVTDALANERLAAGEEAASSQMRAGTGSQEQHDSSARGVSELHETARPAASSEPQVAAFEPPSLGSAAERPIDAIARHDGVVASTGQRSSREHSLRRLVVRMTLDGDPADETESSPLDRLASRLADGGQASDGTTILDRLAQYGIVPGEQPLSESPSEVSLGSDSSSLLMERVYLAETSRLLLVVGFAAAVLVAGWFVIESVAATTLSGGGLDQSSLRSLDLARRSTLVAFGIALSFIPLWCATTSSAARRAGLSVPASHLYVVSFVVALVAAAVPIFLDDPESNVVAALGMVVSLSMGLGSLWRVRILLDRLGRGPDSLVGWSVAVSLVAFALVLGRFDRAVSAYDSLGRLTFVGGLLVVGGAVQLIVAAVVTTELEERVRLSLSRAQQPPQVTAGEPSRSGSAPTP